MGLAVAAGVSPTARAIWPFDSGDERSFGERASELLSRAIAIRTVDSVQAERELARLLVDAADDAGLDADLVETDAGRSIAWARLDGDGAGRPIVLLSHLDVVPAVAEEWSVPPFEGRIANGHVIGRGALDAKGIAVVHLHAMAALADRDEPLPRDVILIVTPDEESGGREGAGWLIEKAPKLLADAEFVLTEGGNVRVGGPRVPNVWGVAVAEKSPCWLELDARGRSGHSAMPSADAAVPRLVAALDAVRRIETGIHVTPEVQRMYRAFARAAPAEDRPGYLDLRRALTEDRRFRRRFLGNPGHNALVRNTLAITVLEGGDRTNVVPARARARIDARLLPGESCDDLAHAVANVVADDAVAVRTLLDTSSPASPIETPLFEAIARVAAREDPGSLVVPRLIAGSTDARHFRSIGITSYGFTPRWLTAPDTRGIHGANESVSIANLDRGVRTLVAILVEVGGE